MPLRLLTNLHLNKEVFSLKVGEIIIKIIIIVIIIIIAKVTMNL